MRIAIYVVDAEKYQQQLSDVRLDFVTYFGGLTEYPNNKGYWYDKGVLYCDNVSIWEIYTDKKLSEFNQPLTLLVLKIKEVTKQLSQLIVVDNKPTFYNSQGGNKNV